MVVHPEDPRYRQYQNCADAAPVHAQAVEEQGAGRAINRHKFTLEEAEANLERPVVRALLQLMRFRNTHPAFNGQVPPDCSHVRHLRVSKLLCCKACATPAAFSIHRTSDAYTPQRPLCKVIL